MALASVATGQGILLASKKWGCYSTPGSLTPILDYCLTWNDNAKTLKPKMLVNQGNNVVVNDLRSSLES